jgi:hypothetical protein
VGLALHPTLAIERSNYLVFRLADAFAVLLRLDFFFGDVFEEAFDAAFEDVFGEVLELDIPIAEEVVLPAYFIIELPDVFTDFGIFRAIVRALAPATPPITAPTAALTGPSSAPAAAPAAAPPTMPSPEETLPSLLDFLVLLPAELQAFVLLVLLGLTFFLLMAAILMHCLTNERCSIEQTSYARGAPVKRFAQFTRRQQQVHNATRKYVAVKFCIGQSGD